MQLILLISDSIYIITRFIIIGSNHFFFYYFTSSNDLFISIYFISLSTLLYNLLCTRF